MGCCTESAPNLNPPARGTVAADCGARAGLVVTQSWSQCGGPDAYRQDPASGQYGPTTGEAKGTQGTHAAPSPEEQGMAAFAN